MDFVMTVKDLFVAHGVSVGYWGRGFAGAGLLALIVFYWMIITFMIVGPVHEEKYGLLTNGLIASWLFMTVINKIFLLAGYGMPGITLLTFIFLLTSFTSTTVFCSLKASSEFRWYGREISFGAVAIVALTDYLWIPAAMFVN